MHHGQTHHTMKTQKQLSLSTSFSVGVLAGSHFVLFVALRWCKRKANEWIQGVVH